ncbi:MULTISPECIES: peptidoglycan-binding protein [Methylobacterium]|jgi:peptidoglycan hydrolase-like protein with peptidoglycan-binding domain|uniref:Peptidoglycan binding-like domain-containing protein n=1 Tax=Methylobacterium hispanicum TaxID=270350 RepID=A0AAV4ZY35_9HYPH|nr:MULTISPECIES: peptidoglycan-binding protein [Methylobacterium]GJD92501.1 hypothetical protein BHAOGJBA_6055 [Methylobacterium hispanicum]
MDVAAIQRALIARGYDLGTGGPSGRGDDGDAGPRTEAALKAFQLAAGLPASGRADAAALAALIPAPARPAAVWPLQADCLRVYGAVGQHQTALVLPFPMRLAWDKASTVRNISVHETVHDSAARAFARIAAAYDEAARARIGLDVFGGSLNVRKMRGGTAYSMHSWGIAIDFDPERNQLAWGRDRARLAQPDAAEFWRIWEAEGWVSLGRARNMDWMHVQAARLA